MWPLAKAGTIFFFVGYKSSKHFLSLPKKKNETIINMDSSNVRIVAGMGS